MGSPAQPRTTVVIATRNRWQSLQRTLEELRALPERPPIVVVDNGSEDGTPFQLRDRGDVELLELGRNAGAAARTEGARRARTPYVAFSDDDSWWRPGALELAADLLDDHPRLGLVAGRVVVGPEERTDPTSELMARSPLSGERELPGRPVLGFIACASVVRRSAFLAVGGFHPRLLTGGEEELLALDLASRRWALRYVDDVVAVHQPSPSRDPGGRRHALARNGLWTAWLRRRPAAALRRSAAVAGSARHDPATRAGAVAALRGAAWALRERRPVPPQLEAAARLLDAS